MSCDESLFTKHGWYRLCTDHLDLKIYLFNKTLNIYIILDINKIGYGYFGGIVHLSANMCQIYLR